MNAMKKIVIPGQYMTINGNELFYTIVNEEGKNVPIIVLNGGPGGAFNSYYLTMQDIAFSTDRPMLFYDQVGGGRSLKEGMPDSYWRMETWMDELEAIVEHFGYKEVILLGHSFGGMLAIATAIERKPKWLKGLILSSTLCSSKMWEEDTLMILSKLPKKIRETLLKGINSGDYESEEYKRAEAAYYRKCIHPKFRYSAKKMKKNEAYVKAWGPSEFAPLGTLKDYDYSSRLGEISVLTLLIYGSEDESTPRANAYMYEHMVCPRKMVELGGLHHGNYRENPASYCYEAETFIEETGL